MRQISLIFLLCVVLFSSGYRFRCFFFCKEQTAVQNDYVENRDDCQDYAQAKLDDAMANSPNPDSEKAQQAKLVSLFSECMVKKGWDVPSGSRKTAYKDDSFPAITTPSAVASVNQNAAVVATDSNANPANATQNNNATTNSSTDKQLNTQPAITKKTGDATNNGTTSNGTTSNGVVPAPVSEQNNTIEQQPQVIKKQFPQEPQQKPQSQPQSQIIQPQNQALQPQPQPSPTPTAPPATVPATIVEQPANVHSQPQPTIKVQPAKPQQVPSVVKKKTTPKNVLRLPEEQPKNKQIISSAAPTKSTQVAAPVQSVEAQPLSAQPTSQPQTTAQKLAMKQTAQNSAQQGEAKKAAECAFARTAAKFSSAAVAKAEECDLECADKLKTGTKIRPVACPPDVLMNNTISNK